MYVVDAGSIKPPIEVKRSVIMTFDGDYNSTVRGREVYFVTVLHNKLAARYPDVLFTDFETQEGVYANAQGCDYWFYRKRPLNVSLVFVDSRL